MIVKSPENIDFTVPDLSTHVLWTWQSAVAGSGWSEKLVLEADEEVHRRNNELLAAIVCFFD